MDFTLTPDIDAREAEGTTQAQASGEGGFSISTRPVIVGSGTASDATQEPALPRSYGTQAVWLMPRDPHRLFAYWDIDWQLAFADQIPADHKAHLRVLNAEGAQESELEVEPLAGSCYVAVMADATYSAELGFYSPPGTWNLLAQSPAVTSPSESVTLSKAVDFTTVPFHLSFQQMIDLLGVYKRENESLTAALNQVRDRAAMSAQNIAPSVQPDRLPELLQQTASDHPTPASPAPDLWATQNLAMSAGPRTSSPTSGFGGSSRPA